jgi:hypothetical protein
VTELTGCHRFIFFFTTFTRYIFSSCSTTTVACFISVSEMDDRSVGEQGGNQQAGSVLAAEAKQGGQLRKKQKL